MIKNITFCLLLFASHIAAGQATDLIVNLKSGKTQDFIKQLQGIKERAISYKMLSKDLDIILVSADSDIVSILEQSNLVEYFGVDSEISKRNTPSDERFGSQWGLKLMDMELAWDIAVGGKFDKQHDIVIAVLDDGFDLDHEDLVANIYQNEDETPGNNIDDDSNGYIDDFRGLNIETGSDDHPKDDHGTAVAGIIGAQGNNEKGVAGVMWDVKILPISKVSRQSEVIESLQYVVDARRKWNNSGGAEGTLIVATNYSAGIDMAFGSDPQYKSWCDMYDLLGSVGILNTGATANVSIDVDIEGDMPTTCPSDYLIAVTNVVAEDVLASNAAYGALNIDLAAPGGTELAPMIALDINNTYGKFNGTSGATPHVAGTIGLLYSLDCPILTELVYNNPAMAAVMVRDAIYQSVDANSTLSGMTATGGRLNAHSAIQQILEACKGSDESTINDIQIMEGTAKILYTTVDAMNYYLSIADALGRQIYDGEIPNPAAGAHDLELTQLQLTAGIYYFSIYNDKSINSKTVRIRK